MDMDNEMCFRDLDQMERRQLQFCDFFFVIGDIPILLSYPGPPVPNEHIKPGFDTAASDNI